jgi:hypothetical protein
MIESKNGLEITQVMALFFFFFFFFFRVWTCSPPALHLLMKPESLLSLSQAKIYSIAAALQQT